MRVGGKVVPVEPDNTMNLDPEALQAAVTPRTRVIVPVHLYGQPCNMTAIERIAASFSLKIVEDNAQVWEQAGAADRPDRLAL